MATFLDREVVSDRRGRFAALLGSNGTDSDRENSRILAGALPVRHRIVVADIGLGGTWSADALERLSSAVGEHRPGGVVAWDLAGQPATTSPARVIAAHVDDLLSPDSDSRALSEYVHSRPGGHDFLGTDEEELSDLELEDVLTVLMHHRQTVVVRARFGEPAFLRLLDGADVVVLPVPHAEDSAARVVAVLDELRASGHSESADRIVVVKHDAAQSMSRSGSTDIRRTLGEAGIRTVLDVPPAESAGRRETDVDVRRAWSHVAAVVTRPRGPVRRELAEIDWSESMVVDHGLPDMAQPFDVTTATLRARSSESTRRRRRGYLPVVAAMCALLVAGGLATTVLVKRSAPVAVAEPTAAEPTAAEPAATSVDPARASGPAVITRYDDFYYRDRDAAAAAALWDLSDSAGIDATVADLQRSIDAVDPAIRHRIDVVPTANPSVFDAVLTLTLPDGRDFRYDQQFTVREDDDGFAIVRKIDCTGLCPAP